MLSNLVSSYVVTYRCFFLVLCIFIFHIPYVPYFGTFAVTFIHEINSTAVAPSMYHCGVLPVDTYHRNIFHSAERSNREYNWTL